MECPICLEGEIDIIFDCNHGAHRECLSGLQDKRCPLCRRELTNLPLELDSKIESNVTERKREEYIEERATITTDMIESGQVGLSSWLQYIAALATLRKSFSVPEDQLPILTKEQVEERFGKFQPFTEVADTLIIETVERLGLQARLIELATKE